MNDAHAYEIKIQFVGAKHLGCYTMGCKFTTGKMKKWWKETVALLAWAYHGVLSQGGRLWRTVLSYGILSYDAFGYKPNLIYKPFLPALPYASMPLATDHVQVNPNKGHIRICWLTTMEASQHPDVHMVNTTGKPPQIFSHWLWRALLTPSKRRTTEQLPWRTPHLSFHQKQNGNLSHVRSCPFKWSSAPLYIE
jgi:hypothetical protein